MPEDHGKEWTFDTVASSYEKIRPGYPDELYRAVFAYRPIGPSSHAVEVGIGGGQATLPVLKTGCAVTAVEYGEQLAKVCREKFSGYPGFSALTGRFEQVTLPDDAYDLVYSASAFHWIPEEIGYTKVFQILKSGGAFTRFANHPFRAKDDPDLFGAINEVYAQLLHVLPRPILFSQAAISSLTAWAGNLRLSSQVTLSATRGCRFFALEPRPLDAEVQRVTRVLPPKS